MDTHSAVQIQGIANLNRTLVHHSLVQLNGVAVCIHQGDVGAGVLTVVVEHLGNCQTGHLHVGANILGGQCLDVGLFCLQLNTGSNCIFSTAQLGHGVVVCTLTGGLDHMTNLEAFHSLGEADADRAGSILQIDIAAIDQGNDTGNGVLLTDRAGYSLSDGSLNCRTVGHNRCVRLGACGGNELEVELGLALVCRIAVCDVVGAGAACGLEGFAGIVGVSTQIVLTAVDVIDIQTSVCGVLPVTVGRGGQMRTLLALGVLVDLNIGLGFAIHEVEANTLTFSFDHVDVNALVICTGLQVILCGDLAVEIDVLAQRRQLHLHLVGGVLCQGTHIDLHDTAALDPLVQSTTGAEFQLALVVFDNTGNGDLIGNTDIGCICALHTVALDLCAADQHGYGHVAIAGIVSVINADDLTGQGCTVLQLFTGSQLCCIPQDLCLIGGGLQSCTAAADTLDHLRTGVKFDGTLVVLNDTLNGNQVIDCNVLHICALQTVAQNGILAVAFHLNDNRNVAVGGIVRIVDLDDRAGQLCGIRQYLTVRQSIGFLQDLTGIGGCFNCVTLLYCVQDTACVKFDGAIVVLQGTGNGNDVADQQLLSAFALQAVALDGLAFCALDLDGNCDVLVVIIPNGVNGDDLATESGLVRQAFAGLQRIGSLDNSNLIHCLGQDIVPAVSSGIAVLISNGCRQHIGGILGAFLIDVDGNSAVVVDNDLDHVLAQVCSPNYLIGNTGNTDDAETLVVHGCFCAVILINCLQVLDNILNIRGCFCLHRGCGGRFCGNRGLLLAAAAGQHTGQHDYEQDPCK